MLILKVQHVTAGEGPRMTRRDPRETPTLRNRWRRMQKTDQLKRGPPVDPPGGEDAVRAKLCDLVETLECLQQTLFVSLY